MKSLNIILVFVFSMIVQQTFCQQNDCNFSELRNKSFQISTRSAENFSERVREDMGGNGEKGLPKWGGTELREKQKNNEPNVSSVYILCDLQASLEGEVTSSNIQGGFLKIQVYNAKHEPITSIEPVTVRVDGANTKFQLQLTDLDIGFFQSTYLKFTYLRKENSKGTRDFWLKMSKSWKSIPKNEAPDIVTVKPIGLSLKLKNSNQSFVTTPKQVALSAMPQFKAIQHDSVNTSPQGPNVNDYFSLYNQLSSDAGFNNPAEVSPIQTGFIFRDKNPNSKTLYYIPSKYSLKWDAEDGYAFSIQYNNTSERESESAVSMSAELTSGISSADHDRIKTLINKLIPNSDNVSLKPIIPQSPLVQFQADGFNLSDISAIAPSNIYSPINISWTCSTLKANDIITALSNKAGISGQVNYNIDGENFSIDATLNLSDRYTYQSALPVDNTLFGAGLKNNTPFPISLNRINMLVLDSQSETEKYAHIYSWTLDNKTVKTGNSIKFQSQDFPMWIFDDERVVDIWMDYEVNNCSDCAEEALYSITRGSNVSAERWIMFHPLNILSKYGASILKINIQSAAVDPRGQSVKTISKSITSDNQDYSIGPLYAWLGDEIQYEVQFELINDEGTQTSKWVPMRESEVYITEQLMKNAFGNRLQSKN